MPLDPSMSMSEIIRKEMKAGKPQKQAVAIAYAVKRRGDAAGYLDAFIARRSRDKPTAEIEAAIRREHPGLSEERARAIAASARRKQIGQAAMTAHREHGDRAAFIRAVGDAARAGRSPGDALSQGLAVAEEAKLANGGDFFTQVRKGVRDGLSARDTLARALDGRR
jgi:hypothetical protein